MTQLDKRLLQVNLCQSFWPVQIKLLPHKSVFHGGVGGLTSCLEKIQLKDKGHELVSVKYILKLFNLVEYLFVGTQNLLRC